MLQTIPEMPAIDLGQPLPDAKPLAPSRENVPARLLPWLNGPRPQLCGPTDSDRGALESGIRAKYQACYQARIKDILPWLMSIGNAERLCATLGWRAAEPDNSLFLEVYLDQPIEQRLSSLAGQPIARSQIVEIGNLVSTWRGSSQLLFILTGYLLAELGYRWLVFTATPQVQKLLQRLDMQPLRLCQADPQRLGAAREDWGSYYHSRPQVMAGYLPAALEQLRGKRYGRALLKYYQQEIAQFKAQFEAARL